MTEYFVGTTIKITDELTLTTDGTPVTPSSITITITDPGGTDVVSDTAMTSTGEMGEYEYSYTFDQTGTWMYTLTATSVNEVTVHRGLVLIV